MTPEEFASLLSLFGSDRDRAAERYEEYRRRLIRLFEWWGCEIPEDLTDVTFDRFARRSAEKGFKLEKPDPWSYIYSVARFVFLEYLRSRKEIPNPDGPEQPVDPVVPDPEPEDPRLPCFRRCLENLTEGDRQLLFAFHPEEERIRARKQLAQELGISPNALRIKVHRVRKDLKECMAKCRKAEGR